MTTATRDVLERLKALAELDAQIQQLEKDLLAVPAAAKDLAAEVTAAEQKAKALEDKNRLFRAQVKLRENELRSVEQKIQKVKEQSSTVKTNKEFMAFRAELSTFQADADRLQGEILKILEVVQGNDKQVETHRQERASAEARRKDAEAKAEGKVSGSRARRDELLAKRKPMLDALPAEQREVYERVRKSRGNALSAIEGEYCSGCMERLTKNDVIAVQNGSRLVTCKACNRILVWG